MRPLASSKFKLTLLQNHHCHTIKTRRHWRIKVCYHLLNQLGSYKITMDFRLVLEGKTGQEMPESSRFEFLKKSFANNYALLEADDNPSGPLNRGGIADLPLLRTLLANRQKSLERSFSEVMDSCFSRIINFDSFKNTFATVTSLAEFHYWYRKFVLLVQTIDMICISYGNRASSCKSWRWIRFDLLLKVKDICINSSLDPLASFLSSRSIEFTDILPWNIS